MRLKLPFYVTAMCLALCACSFAPPDKTPITPVSNHYKEAIAWIEAKPRLAQVQKNQMWWHVYEDKALNILEQQLTQSNPSLKLAYSRFEEAKAWVMAATSQMYPTLMANGGESRQQNSERVANSFNQSSFVYSTTTLQMFLSYEIDAWGAVRNTVEASIRNAAASQYDLAAIDLSLHAELASIYFQLRGDDAMQIVLDKIVASYHHAWSLMHHLHQGGAVSALEEDQALSQLEHAKTAALDMRMQRAKLGHALAVLVGDIPATFKLPPMTSPVRFVALSPDAPTTLLERRPDVASAIESVKAANATIGVARAAFFPSFNLLGLIGVQSQKINNLFSRPSLIWALGPPSGLTLITPEVSQVIFDGYYLQANLRRAKAVYYETVSAYQQVVLKAFREVEDGLVETYRLNQENQKQSASTAAAKRTLYQANQRMKEGMDTYLNVVDIEVNALQLELNLIYIQTQRQLASVYLIKALGGGWKQPAVPNNPDPIPRIH